MLLKSFLLLAQVTFIFQTCMNQPAGCCVVPSVSCETACEETSGQEWRRRAVSPPVWSHSAPLIDSTSWELWPAHRKKKTLIVKDRQQEAIVTVFTWTGQSHLLQSPVPHPAERNAVYSAAWEPLHRHIQTSPTWDTADLHWSRGWEKEISKLSSAKIMKGVTDEYFKSLIMNCRAPDLPFRVLFPISSVGGAEYRPDRLSSWLPHTAPCWSW